MTCGLKFYYFQSKISGGGSKRRWENVRLDEAEVGGLLRTRVVDALLVLALACADASLIGFQRDPVPANSPLLIFIFLSSFFIYFSAYPSTRLCR